MKKTFLVEIDYEETPQNIRDNSPVLYDTAVECTLEDMMYGYASAQSISLSHGYNVDVTQLDENDKDIKDKIVKNLQARYNMAKEDEECFDYIEGLCDAVNIARGTK